MNCEVAAEWVSLNNPKYVINAVGMPIRVKIVYSMYWKRSRYSNKRNKRLDRMKSKYAQPTHSLLYGRKFLLKYV